MEGRIPVPSKEVARIYLRNPCLHRPKGKVAELRQELINPAKKDKNHSAKKNALKKIVANMTMSNNDMVALFPDIVACMQIPVLEIKKMYVRSFWNCNPTDGCRCFLYLQHYARLKPDVALRALPFLQDVSISFPTHQSYLTG